MLGNDAPEASVPGEIIPSREFYDYESKYLDEGSKIVIPADLPKKIADQVRKLSIEAFKAIDGAGMSRVDFLLSRDDGALFVNEVNTIPGFTTISMFAKLWAASGVDYPVLLDRLIALARRSATPKSSSSAPASHDHGARWLPVAQRSVLLRAAVRRVLVSVSVSQPGGPRGVRGELAGVDGLVRVYDAILDARFDAGGRRAEARVRRGRRRAKRATCSRRRPPGGASCSIPTAAPSTGSSRPRSTQAIRSTEAWAAREPQNAEAHFYAGAAYAARVQWRVLREERLAAARDGKRIKQALERAIALDPDLDDAYFGDRALPGTTPTSRRRRRRCCGSC